MIATYLWLYSLTFMASFLLTPAVIILIRKLDLLDIPDERKIHTYQTPRGGGLGFSTIWLASVVLMLLAGSFLVVKHQLVIGLLVGAGLTALIGLVDDWRGISSFTKLLSQIAAAIVFLAIARPAILTGYPSYLIAVFWIVAITNAMNLIDGLDGLAIGLAAISAASFAIFSFSGDQNLVFLLALPLLGICLGFLPYNWHPAKIFMGDVGSYFLGFILSALAIFSIKGGNGISAILMPMFFLAVPIFDVCLSVIRRIVYNKPLFKPDKSHFYNLLMNRGFSHRDTVIFCYILAILSSTASFGFLFTAGVLFSIAILAGLTTVFLIIAVRLRLLAVD